MGNDESHFNVSVINCEGQSHNETVSTSHNLSEEKEEPKQNRTEALPLTATEPNALQLGQTGLRGFRGGG